MLPAGGGQRSSGSDEEGTHGGQGGKGYLQDKYPRQVSGLSARRKHFRELFERSLEEEGVIVRTCAENVRDEELLKELSILRSKWEAIKKKARGIKTGIVYEEIPVYAQLIRDHWYEITEIVIDDREMWSDLIAYLEENFPELINRIRYVKSISVFFKRYELDKALARLAMTVIDVNSGAGCGDTLEETALQTNLEAAEEIARQIKLRDIGGIVIIDFIDMKDRRNKDILVRRMKELFADEGAKVHIYGITQLGLLELTRKKETPSVTRLLSIDCPHCRGKGYIKSPEVVLYEIEKEIGYFKGRYLELRINPSLKERIDKLLESKNLKDWVSVKLECNAPLDYYEMFFSG